MKYSKIEHKIDKPLNKPHRNHKIMKKRLNWKCDILTTSPAKTITFYEWGFYEYEIWWVRRRVYKNIIIMWFKDWHLSGFWYWMASNNSSRYEKLFMLYDCTYYLRHLQTQYHISYSCYWYSGTAFNKTL